VTKTLDICEVTVSTTVIESAFLFNEGSELAQKSPAREESETFAGILLFGLGAGLFATILSPLSGGFGFIIGFISGLLLGGGLELIIHR
jgi:hypothetical protein